MSELLIVLVVGIVVGVGLLLFLIIAISSFFSKIRRRMRSVSSLVGGLDGVLQSASQIQAEYEATPKSVAAMTSLCLPRIHQDFPEWNYDEMREQAEATLITYLNQLSGSSLLPFQYAGSELEESIRVRLDSQARRGLKEHYEGIKIHRTEISSYQKEQGRCVVTFQSSLQYRYYVTEHGSLTQGSKTSWTQARYEMDYVYIQDRDKVDTMFDSAQGVNCPNCGAPIQSLGSKVCAYCSTPVIPINLHAWTILDVRQLR